MKNKPKTLSLFGDEPARNKIQPKWLVCKGPKCPKTVVECSIEWTKNWMNVWIEQDNTSYSVCSEKCSKALENCKD